MLLLFGTSRKTKPLGRLAHGCMRCRQQAYFTYVRSSSWFTFFFIPVIPLGSETRAVCGACGFQQVVPNAAADHALAQAAQAAQLPRG